MCKRLQHSENVISVDLDKPDVASIFDLFTSIELIPLETSPEVLIAGIRKIITHGDRFYTLDPVQSIIFVFDHSGKFIFKIDRKGRGPGEYVSITDFSINPYSSNLELLQANGFVHVFDLSGNFIETKNINYTDFRAVHMIASTNDNTHVFYAQFQPKKIIYYDLDDKKLLYEEFEEDWRLGSYGVRSFFKYSDDWYFFRPIHPVVYKIGKERLEAAYQFDFGKYTKDGITAIFSEEVDNNRSKLVEEVFAQFPYVITTVRHNNKYVFATLLWKDPNNKGNVIYNKSTGVAQFILDFVEQVEFNPDNIVTDEYILVSCQWVNLEKLIKREMLDDKNKETFDKLMMSEIELNPVFIKYHFK